MPLARRPVITNLTLEPNAQVFGLLVLFQQVRPARVIVAQITGVELHVLVHRDHVVAQVELAGRLEVALVARKGLDAMEKFDVSAQDLDALCDIVALYRGWKSFFELMQMSEAGLQHILGLENKSYIVKDKKLETVSVLLAHNLENTTVDLVGNSSVSAGLLKEMNQKRF